MEEAHAGICGGINQGQNYMIVSKEWAITSPPWCMTVLTLPKDVMHVNYMLTSFTNLGATPPNRSVLAF